MAISTTSFDVTFQLDTGTFKITDTATYPGADLNDITGNIRIIDPSGDIIETVNEDDILKGSGDDNVTTIYIPKLGNGEYVKGNYTFQYTAVDADDSSTASATKTFDFCYESPTVDVQMSYDCVAPLLTAKDSSDYRVDGVTPTVSREVSLHYPPLTGLQPLTATTSTLTTSTFYTQTHTGVVVSELTYSYQGGFTVTDKVSGQRDVDVVCDTSLCGLYCCLSDLYKDFRDAQGKNLGLAKDLEEKWIRAEALRCLVKDAYECGKQDEAKAYIEEIRKITGCTDDCGCQEGDEPTLITSISSPVQTPTTGGGGSGTVVVEAEEQGTYGLQVSKYVNGDETKYVVGIEPDTLLKISEARNTLLTAGTGVTLSESIGTNGERVYEVSTSTTPVESIEMVCRVSTDFTTSIPTIEVMSEVIKGTKFQSPTMYFSKQPATLFEAWQEITDPSEANSSNVRIIIKDFLSTASDEYIPSTECLGVYKRLPTGGPIPGNSNVLTPTSLNWSTLTSFTGVDITDPSGISVNEFVVSLFNAGGTHLTGGGVDRTRRFIGSEYFYFTIKIS